MASFLYSMPVHAQREDVSRDSCTSAIPPKAFKRVPVFLQATTQSTGSDLILPTADLFAQTAAIRMREILGGNGSALPEADSIVGWDRVFGEVLVTVKRGGSFTWRTAHWSARGDSLGRSSIRFIHATLADLSKSGEMIAWPDQANGDSLAFGLSFIAPSITKEMKVEPVKARQAFPAFSLSMPWGTVVDPKKINITYPTTARGGGVTGGVRLAFVIQKSGRVDMSTLREVFGPGEKKPSGELRTFYVDFLQAVKHGLSSAQYQPATIAGCPVNQTVEQFFSFKLDR
jgi:hypothetical protein